MSGIIQALFAGYGGETFVEATGGTQTTITQGGVQYRVHTFTGNGTFTVIEGGEVEYMIVGGGGGGGAAQNERSSPGRGGQVLINSFIAVPGNVSVARGGGGARVFWANGGRRGGASSLSGPGVSVSAQGGRGGDSRAFINGVTQGSSGQSGFAGNGTSTTFNGTNISFGLTGPSRSLNSGYSNGAANRGNGGSNAWNVGNVTGGAGGTGIIRLRYRIG